MSHKFSRAFSGFIILLILASANSFAQGRVTYQDLAARSDQQNIYIDFFTLPASGDKSVQFVSTFRINYNFLPFKKLKSPSGSNRFYSHVGLNMEVFKARKKRDRDEEIPIKGMSSVVRTAWSDTAFAKNYEQTQSNESYIDGFMKVDVEPGLYNYMLQLKRGESIQEQNSRTRQIHIRSFRDKKLGKVIFADNVRDRNNSKQLELLNLGQQVYYGKDFYALLYIPSYDENESYAISVNRIDISREDTTFQNEVFSTKLNPENIQHNTRPTLAKESGKIILSLNTEKGSHTYALVKIPNRKFPNAIYRIQITQNGDATPVSIGVFRSLWTDMPTSLLNLDVATEMLRFIISEESLNKLKKGSEAEREKKFREFWKSKDPTPNTEFNELMAEYYRRIDYAYEQFSTVNMLGYNSDQGKIYIRNGPPKNIERKYPTGEPTVEIWTYEDRKFVFQATSGFGDFRLLRN